MVLKILLKNNNGAVVNKIKAPVTAGVFLNFSSYEDNDTQRVGRVI